MPEDPRRPPLSVRIPDDQRAAIEALAHAKRVPYAVIVRWALDLYLKRQRRKPA